MRKTLAALLAGRRPVLLDGGMWRFLQSMGLGSEPPEAWNLTHPENVEAVHRAYVEAGAEIVYTNTLGANRRRLAHAGLADRLVEINTAAARAALAAAGDRALVAGDISSTGEMLAPYGDLSTGEAEDLYREQAAALAGAGVDLFVVETMMDAAEALAAIRGIQSVSGLPVICTMTFERGGRTLMGAAPAEVAPELAALGVAALGANCSTGPADMAPVIRAFAGACGLPVVAKPNAGLPELVEGRTVFPEGPADFAVGAKRLVEAGARLVGGCCGTTPEHIRALRALL